MSLVGAKSVEEAALARRSGADAILIKSELVMLHAENPAAFMEELKDVLAGDDF